MAISKTLGALTAGALAIGAGCLFVSAALARRTTHGIVGYSANFAMQDLTDNSQLNGTTTCRGTLFVSLQGPVTGIRRETEYGNKKRILISRNVASFIVEIDPQARTYWRPRTKAVLMATDGSETVGEVNQREYLGEELIHNRPTSHYRIHTTDAEGKTLISEYWEDVALHIAVRQLRPGKDDYQLFDIREGAQSPALFDLPSGYALIQNRE